MVIIPDDDAVALSTVSLTSPIADLNDDRITPHEDILVHHDDETTQPEAESTALAKVGRLINYACHCTKAQVSRVSAGRALKVPFLVMGFALFMLLYLGCASPSYPASRLFIPAAALPSATEDIVLSSLPPTTIQTFQIAIDAAITASREADFERSLFGSLSKVVKEEVILLKLSTPASWGHSSQDEFIHESLRLNNQRLALYSELLRKAEERVAQAQETVAALLRHVDYAAVYVDRPIALVS
jgi:hypothetical protein